MEEPMVLVYNTDGKLQVNPEALKLLGSIEDRLVVVAVAGAYRTGKSYLLNCLAGVRKGFSLGSSVQSHTKGIWMWCRPLPQRPGHHLLLLDTEGLGDPEKGDSDNDTSIFSLAILLSSIFIYNCRGNIDQHSMADLHFVTELSKRIQVKSQPNVSDSQDFVRFFPEFVWVIRDLNLDLETKGMELSADKYLECCLSLREDENSERNREYNNLRRGIRDHFPTRRCFAFPCPAHRKKLKWLQEMEDEDLDEDFVKELQTLHDYVHAHEKVKRVLGGHQVTGRRFAKLTETYVGTMAEGGLPCVETSVARLMEVENKAALDKALAFYRQKMSRFSHRGPEPLSKLLEDSNENHKEALKIFMNKSIYDPSEEHIRELEEAMSSHYNSLIGEIEAESRKRCEAFLSEVMGPIQEKLDSGHYLASGGYQELDSELSEAVNKYRAATKDEVQGNDVLAHFLEEKKPLLDQVLKEDRKLTEEKHAVEKELSREKEKVEKRQRKTKAAEESRNKELSRVKEEVEKWERNFKAAEERGNKELSREKEEVEKRERERKAAEERRNKELSREKEEVEKREQEQKAAKERRNKELLEQMEWEREAAEESRNKKHSKVKEEVEKWERNFKAAEERGNKELSREKEEVEKREREREAAEERRKEELLEQRERERKAAEERRNKELSREKEEVEKREQERKAAEERRNQELLEQMEWKRKAAEERRKEELLEQREREREAAEERRKEELLEQMERERKAAEERRKEELLEQAERERKAAEERREEELLEQTERERKAAEERRKEELLEQMERERKVAEERRKEELSRAKEELEKWEREWKAAEERRNKELSRAKEEVEKREREWKAAVERRNKELQEQLKKKFEEEKKIKLEELKEAMEHKQRGVQEYSSEGRKEDEERVLETYRHLKNQYKEEEKRMFETKVVVATGIVGAVAGGIAAGVTTGLAGGVIGVVAGGVVGGVAGALRYWVSS